MTLREATGGDWPQIWDIISHVHSENDTYMWPADFTEDQARAEWLSAAPKRTRVLVEDDRILGVAIFGPNRPGPGRHVGTASFLVHHDARGRGVGRRLVVDTLDQLWADGYSAVQFNAVIATNVAAVRLYEDLGFSIVGTVPEAFEHPTQGRVALHVMHRRLDPGA